MALDIALKGINIRLKACQARCKLEQKNQTRRRQQRIPRD